MNSNTPATSIAFDENEAAKALGMSLAWLRRDRRTKRLLPFYRIGGCIRYNPETLRKALAAFEEGGVHLKPRKRATKAKP